MNWNAKKKQEFNNNINSEISKATSKDKHVEWNVELSHMEHKAHLLGASDKICPNRFYLTYSSLRL